jgi:sugar-specific transcriptional regulator TrmB
MSIERVLIALDFQETEVKFYVAALELGQSPISDIARKAGISRTNGYAVFARLLEQGLVVEVGGAPKKTMLIAAEEPQRLLELFEARLQKINEALPELKSLYNRSRTKPRVRFYQGLDGIKQILNDMLAVLDQHLLGILSMRDLYEVAGREWMEDLVRRRIAVGAFLRVIRPTLERRAQHLTSERRRPARGAVCTSRVLVAMTSYLYDDKVALISSRRENFAMTIESEEMATIQRHLFEISGIRAHPCGPPSNLLRRRSSCRAVVDPLHFGGFDVRSVSIVQGGRVPCGAGVSGHRQDHRQDGCAGRRGGACRRLLGGVSGELRSRLSHMGCGAGAHLQSRVLPRPGT